MSRTLAFILTIASIGVTVCGCIYLLRGTPHAEVLLAVASILGALVGAGAVALVNRTVPPCNP